MAGAALLRANQRGSCCAENCSKGKGEESERRFLSIGDVGGLGNHNDLVLLIEGVGQRLFVDAEVPGFLLVGGDEE